MAVPPGDEDFGAGAVGQADCPGGGRRGSGNAKEVATRGWCRSVRLLPRTAVPVHDQREIETIAARAAHRPGVARRGGGHAGQETELEPDLLPCPAVPARYTARRRAQPWSRR